VKNVIKKNYKTDIERGSLIDDMTTLGKILIEDAIRSDERYLLFIDSGENEPYVLEPSQTEPSEIELLKEENALLKAENKVLITSDIEIWETIIPLLNP